MKHLITILFLSLTLGIFSQPAQIKKLEAQSSSLSGLDYINNQIKLSEYYFENRDFDKAARTAEKAFRTAKQLDKVYEMALALNKGGKALLFIQKSRIIQQRKAIGKLHDAVHLLEGTPYDSLQLENLEILRRLAVNKGRKKEASRLEQKMKRLKGDQELALALGGAKNSSDGKNIRQKAKEKLLEFEASNQSLNEQLEELNTENQELSKLLEGREMQIDELSAAQMKSELLLMQQRNLVDSFYIQSLQDSMLLAEQEMDIQKQESLLQFNKSQRNLLLALAGIIVIIGIGFYSRYKGIKRYSTIIEQEKQRSDELLLNILPAPIAEELKQEGAAQARHYKEVTVLFSDFKNFSKIAAILPPEELVAELDYCFKAFDKIIEKYQLEKIKTIGDAYMCAGGLPMPDAKHPKRVIQAALEMQAFLKHWKIEKEAAGQPYFEARLGIHTGPIIAGVVGVKKFAYDIWGDTVNVASRMESSGETGRVNISATTYSIVKDQFNCIPRGKVPAKNHGEIDMFFVEAYSSVNA